jgi:hypothetical protein
MIRLEPLNVHNTFCRGCGIAPAPVEGRECPTCLSIARVAWNASEPLPYKVLFVLLAALGVLIIGIAAALRI